MDGDHQDFSMEVDLESSSIQPIQPVKVRLANYSRQSSPSPLRLRTKTQPLPTTRQDSQSPLRTLRDGESFPYAQRRSPKRSTAPKLHRRHQSAPYLTNVPTKTRTMSSSKPVELMSTVSNQFCQLPAQYVTRSSIQQPSPLTLMNLQQESKYLTRSQVKFWKQKSSCLYHDKLALRENNQLKAPKRQSTPKIPRSQLVQKMVLQAGGAKPKQSLSKLYAHSKSRSPARCRLSPLVDNTPPLTRSKRQLLTGITTPDKTATNRSKHAVDGPDMKRPKSGIMTRMRSLAASIQEKFSKKKKKKQVTVVTNSSKVDSDVQLVNLNSEQKTVQVAESSEPMDTSLPVSCFGTQKINLTAKMTNIRRKQARKKELTTIPPKKSNKMITALHSQKIGVTSQQTSTSRQTMECSKSTKTFVPVGVSAETSTTDLVTSCSQDPKEQKTTILELPLCITPTRRSETFKVLSPSPMISIPAAGMPFTVTTLSPKPFSTPRKSPKVLTPQLKSSKLHPMSLQSPKGTKPSEEVSSAMMSSGISSSMTDLMFSQFQASAFQPPFQSLCPIRTNSDGLADMSATSPVPLPQTSMSSSVQCTETITSPRVSSQSETDVNAANVFGVCGKQQTTKQETQLPLNKTASMVNPNDDLSQVLICNPAIPESPNCDGQHAQSSTISSIHPVSKPSSTMMPPKCQKFSNSMVGADVGEEMPSALSQRITYSTSTDTTVYATEEPKWYERPSCLYENSASTRPHQSMAIQEIPHPQSVMTPEYGSIDCAYGMTDMNSTVLTYYRHQGHFHSSYIQYGTGDPVMTQTALPKFQQTQPSISSWYSNLQAEPVDLSLQAQQRQDDSHQDLMCYETLNYSELSPQNTVWKESMTQTNLSIPTESCLPVLSMSDLMKGGLELDRASKKNQPREESHETVKDSEVTCSLDLTLNATSVGQPSIIQRRTKWFEPKKKTLLVIPSVRSHQSEASLDMDIHSIEQSIPKLECKKRPFEESTINDASLPDKKKMKMSTSGPQQSITSSLVRKPGSPQPAWTENCSECSRVESILEETPYSLLNNVPCPDHFFKSTRQIINEYYDSQSFYRSRGKPHIVARDLVWRLFTVAELHGHRFTTLNSAIAEVIHHSVLDKSQCGEQTWLVNCIPFINRAIRKFFSVHFRKYWSLIEHRCDPSVC